MAEFTFEGKSIHYETYGEGRPLLLLNGIMMSCASWKEFIEPLSAQNLLILLDMLDQGRSDKMTESYDHSVQLRLVDALLDELRLEKVCIAGISYGSEVGLEYAMDHPERVERLMLFNATAATGPWLNDIGKAFGDRDHTTVLHSLDKVEKQMRSDPAFAETVKEITTNINAKR